MTGKLKINATLEVVTGLHIGGSSEYAPIGAIDSPVVSDSRDGLPIVPGSSLKGKMRTLLSESIAGKRVPIAQDDICVKRLFGSTSPIIKARLQFADAFIANKEDFNHIPMTEAKFENTIDRVTLVANPRQIERVVRGVQFNVCIIYNAENEAEIEEDMKNIAHAMKLLQMDYLGGHGTRGSGRVKFSAISLAEANGKFDKLAEYAQILKEAEAYDLLAL